MNSKLKCPTPGTQRAADRCAVLFDVATALFLEHGYDHVSLDQIVERAGGSKATIYKYFGSKKGLFLAICQERCNRFIHQVELACQQDERDIRHNLQNLLSDLYSIFADHQGASFGRLVLQISRNDSDFAQQIYNHGPRKAQMLLANYLQHAHDKKQIYCTQPHDSAIFLLGALHDTHWCSLFGISLKKSEDEFKAHIQYIVERFIAGHQPE